MGNQIYRPRRSNWTSSDTKDATAIGCACLTLIVALFVGLFPYIAWLWLYVHHGSPDLFSQWNAWNISLLVIIGVSVLGGIGQRTRS